MRVVVTGDSNDAQQALEQVGQSADESESHLVKLTRTMAGMAVRGVAGLGVLGAAAVTMGLSTASQLEQVEVGFTTMLGSAEKAQKFMRQLQNFAASTPFEFTELTSSAQQFLAMGFAAKDVIPMLTAVGDAVAAMGGSAENVESVTRALGQMQAKGKVSGEELMQLTEQGIPALRILADSYGVSTTEMSNMITKGQVLSAKAIPALIKGLSEGTKTVKGFGGMMEKQSATMQGKWSTLMDTLQMGLGNLAKYLLPLAKVSIDVLSKAMANFFAGLQGGGKLEGFSGTINEIGLGLHAMSGAFKEGDVTSKGLVGKFEQVAVVTRQVVDALKATSSATMVAVNWFRDHDTTTKALIITMGALLAITKAHAIVLTYQASAGALMWFKNLGLVTSVMKVATALQWAYNGALAAAGYLQIAGYLGLIKVQQMALAAGTKIATAAQWLWNIALNANPIGLIVAAIAILVGAFYLLWKNNEGFRKFILNVLWPGIKKAFEAIKDVVMVVVNALVTAFNWTKDKIIAAWNAIASFLQPAISAIIGFMTPIIAFIGKLAAIFFGFYNAVWKIVWILIQIAVKIFIAYIMNVVVPTIKMAVNIIVAIVKFLYSMFKAYFEFIQLVISKVIGWIMNTAVPIIRSAWNLLLSASAKMRDFIAAVFNAIKTKVDTVFRAIAGPIAGVLLRTFNTLRGWINTLRGYWNIAFDAISMKTSAVMDGVKKAFEKGKNGIQAAWNQIVSITKKPINFVIQDVYNDRIRGLWNKVAEKFGIKTRLDTIPKLAKGGIVGRGYGTKDDQLSLLMRGEGVLTTGEIRRLGGPKGFQEFRQSLAQYSRGGIVGGDGPGSWFKSLASKGKEIFQGVAGSVIKPLVNQLRGFINKHLPADGFSGLMRGGGNTILDKMVAWVAGKDKEIGSIGTGGGAIGYKAMQALIRGRFPDLRMISGYRPGARTLSGNLSYHGFGRAVDYPPVRALAQWIRGTFGARTKELITPWNDLNLHNGRPHRYTGAVWNQHNFAGGNAHVHWAMDGVTDVEPGPFIGFNRTGKTETLVNKDLIPSGITINGGLHLHGVQNVKQLRDEIIKLGKRNGGQTGLP